MEGKQDINKDIKIKECKINIKIKKTKTNSNLF